MLSRLPSKGRKGGYGRWARGSYRWDMFLKERCMKGRTLVATKNKRIMIRVRVLQKGAI